MKNTKLHSNLTSENALGAQTIADNLLAASSPVRRALELSMQGGELSFEEGLLLGECSGADLEALIAVADALRSKSVGEVITYVVNRNINFTNVCFVGCSFCGF